MSATTTEPVLLTAEEFARLPDNGRPTELVRGRVVAMNPPGARHGQVCGRVTRLIGNFAEARDLGHVLSNDSGVITHRDPDTVRGADVAFYSYARVPKGPLSERYLAVQPDLIFEVLSPSDVWSEVLTKVAEYLKAGVRVVCVLYPDSESAYIYYPDRPERVRYTDEELSLPELHEDFRLPVRRFFE